MYMYIFANYQVISSGGGAGADQKTLISPKRFSTWSQQYFPDSQPCWFPRRLLRRLPFDLSSLFSPLPLLLFELAFLSLLLFLLSFCSSSSLVPFCLRRRRRRFFRFFFFFFRFFRFLFLLSLRFKESL